MNFRDKVIWITGASSGIGEQMAYAFAQAGAKLALSARNEEKLKQVQANCPAGAEVLLIPLDVSDFSAVQAAGEAVIDHFGYLNLLINNAGISQRSLVKDTDFTIDHKIMAVNFFGAVAATKAVLPTLLKQQFGQIVVISSVTGKIGTPLRSAYAASKHALIGYFDCLRAELVDDNIEVTVIIPGFINTDVSANALKGDGRPTGIKGEATKAGMAPDVFAQKALRAISQGKKEVYIGGFREWLAMALRRFFPNLLFRMIARAKVT
ncbi:MAG: SDR family oxidoreductase [Lewinella sp.]|nr:SDR family oxidoreductase [Lewinella sp.]